MEYLEDSEYKSYRSIHEIELMKFINETEGGIMTYRMSIPNDWNNHVIVHVSGNLWWNKTTNVKFIRLG